VTEGFQPPPYPYDRLDRFRAAADKLPGGCVDLSTGTPTDAPPAAALEALAASETARSYPPSVGALAFREAAAAWLDRRFGVVIDPGQIAACVGTKELVAGMPQWLRLRTPDRDTVLYPEISYPTYAMGASLAGCRAVPYRTFEDIAAGDARRAVCLWVNSPANPTGTVVDLQTAAEWGRRHGVPVLSDECYIEFTWDGPARTILSGDSDGVIAVHSLSKRSNLAGLRAGFYAGDPTLVRYLSELRKHAGFMVPGPVQAAAVAALTDDEHVDAQRARYHKRLRRMADILGAAGLDCAMPEGTFYLWPEVPGAGDAWRVAGDLAERGGVLVAPGDLYGPAGAGHLRVALVQPEDRIELVADRLLG
jgi:succinyldiaminopimelate transaminase